jgi:hypothetical protein
VSKHVAKCWCGRADLGEIRSRFAASYPGPLNRTSDDPRPRTAGGSVTILFGYRTPLRFLRVGPGVSLGRSSPRSTSCTLAIYKRLRIIGLFGLNRAPSPHSARGRAFLGTASSSRQRPDASWRYPTWTLPRGSSVSQTESASFDFCNRECGDFGHGCSLRTGCAGDETSPSSARRCRDNATALALQVAAPPSHGNR